VRWNGRKPVTPCAFLGVGGHADVVVSILHHNLDRDAKHARPLHRLFRAQGGFDHDGRRQVLGLVVRKVIGHPGDCGA
jgi:hypothetical protein